MLTLDHLDGFNLHLFNNLLILIQIAFHWTSIFFYLRQVFILCKKRCLFVSFYTFCRHTI